MSLATVISAAIASQLERIGAPVTLYAGDDALPLAAYLQPESGAITPSLYPEGRDEGRRWLYRGPATPDGLRLRDGSLVEFGGLWFIAAETKDYRVGGVVVLRCARLIPCQPQPGQEVSV